MNLICKLTDRDIGEEYIEMESPELKRGARGIVINDDGKIAVFYKSARNEYKLPGGGLEGDETPEQAFKREVLEETGCEVEIIDNLGIAEEYKNKTNFKQISYVFVGKVIEDTHELHLTKSEQKAKAMLLWETPEKALELITNCYDQITADEISVYITKFIVTRDRKILEYYMSKDTAK